MNVDVDGRESVEGYVCFGFTSWFPCSVQTQAIISS